jgi:dienelactone hydrolase
MIWRYLRGTALACALLQAMPAAAAPDAPLPSAADYFAQPAIEDPVLSPDGSRVAAKALLDGHARFVLYDLSGASPSVRPIPLPAEERLEWHRWLGPDRLLVSLMREGASPTTRLAAIDLASGKLTPLGAVRPAAEGDEVIHVDRTFLLLKAQPRSHATPAVYRVDLATGATTLAVAAQGHVWEWYADSAGVIRAGMAMKGRRSWMLYRKDEHDRFSRAGGGAGDLGSGIERFVPIRGTDQGYALAEAPSGRVGLYAYDFARSRLGALIHEEAKADLAGLQTDADGRLLGVDYSAERPATRWFDPAMAARQAAIDAALPGRANRVVSASADKARLLVFSESAGDPGAFYLYAGGRAALVAAVSPALVGKRTSEMRAVAYRARDGLEIPAYLTLPVGRDPSRLPLIVMPHGGPFARDDWGYDPWVQYLAGRGYAVLQPNYRGSTGMGRDFRARGDGEWGRGMQADLDDGVDWLVARGIADRGRVCIMGASYGGYAAMWAAAQADPRYRCAVSFAGISDVSAQLAYDRKTFSGADYRNWKRRIQGGAASLDALSPIRFAGRLTMPILIAHGAADETVPADQSVRLHAALVRLGRAHGYVAYAGQGHTLEGQDDNADFLDRVGKFLSENNPS